MAKNLEELKLEMPLVFELREKLAADIASEEVRFREKMDKMRCRLSPDGFEDWANEAYHIHRLSLMPMRQHIEYMTRQIANIAAFFPPQPIIIEREKAR